MSILIETTKQFSTLVENSKIYGGLLLKLLCVIWIINCINWYFKGVLNTLLGITPRKMAGGLAVNGIGTSWICHADFNHLFFNSIPLFIFSLMLLSIYKNINTFGLITFFIIFFQGIMVWLFARSGNHIGSSGLINGYAGFLLTYAYCTNTIISISLGMIILYYFGGILLTIFPGKTKISWESHLFGLIAGISAFWLFK